MQYAISGFGISSAAAAEVGRMIIEPRTTLSAREARLRLGQPELINGRGAWVTARTADASAASCVNTVCRIAGDSSPATISILVEIYYSKYAL
mmetsp:Transcript_14481/g.24137  ORF Transcript_14481/g.24137 Transcript_14481/m.24137 type:complete len:93 (-) Transcript_14481:71-349(-)